MLAIERILEIEEAFGEKIQGLEKGGTAPILFGMDIAVSWSVMKPLRRIDPHDQPLKLFYNSCVFCRLFYPLGLWYGAWSKPQP